MVSTISTTSNSTATSSFNGRKIDRCQDGTLWMTWTGQDNVGSDAALFAYSKDAGATWTALSNSRTVAAIGGAFQSSLMIDKDDFAHIVFRQNGTTDSTVVGGARTGGYLYYMRGTPNADRTAWTWSTAFSLTSATTANFPDVVAHRDGTGWVAHVVWSEASGAPANFAVHERIGIGSDGTLTRLVDDFVVGGSYAVNAHTYPSIDFHHTGDGKTVAGGTPHLYVGWTAGATGAGKGVRFRKAVYSAGAWTWNAEREIDTLVGANDAANHMVCHFDGTRAVLAGYMSRGGGPFDLIAHERDAADTTTTPRRLLDSNTTAADHLFYGSSAYDKAGNLYLFGRDGSGANGSRLVNRRKWTRSDATLGPIVTIDSTGNDTPHLSARRGTQGNSIDVVWTDGTASPYSVLFDRLTLNTAPTAPTDLSPAGNTTLDRTQSQTFRWTFNDPDAGDAQSRFVLDYRLTSATSWTTVDSATVGGGTLTSYTFAAGTFTAGDYEWRVTTYDAQGVVSPTSSSAFFKAASPPAAPTITDPANNAVMQQTGSVTWSYPTQSHYRVRRVADNAGSPDTATVYYDSGDVASTTVRSLGLTFPTNNRFEHIQVRVTDSGSGLTSTYSSVRVEVSYTPPAQPSVTVLPVPEDGYTALAISDPTPTGSQPAVVSHNVHRREGVGLPETRIATGVGGSYRDYSATSGQAYLYRVEAVAANGTSAFSDDVETTLTLAGLWLHDPADPQGTALQLRYDGHGRESLETVDVTTRAFIGRALPVPEWTTRGTLSVSAETRLRRDDAALRDRLLALMRRRAVLCWRDVRGRKVFGVLGEVPLTDDVFGQAVTLHVTAVDWSEAV